MSNNKAKKIQGNDSFHRMNYLYQICKAVAGKNTKLSAYYGNLIISVAKKNVLKLHPDIKRQICKKCRSIIIYTQRVKTKNKYNLKFIEWSCQTCFTKKVFPVSPNRDNRVWVEKEEAVVEEIN